MVAEESPVGTGACVCGRELNLRFGEGSASGRGGSSSMRLASIPVKMMMRQIAGSGGACARCRRAGTGLSEP
jgi:hypothetical protein